MLSDYLRELILKALSANSGDLCGFPRT